MNLTALLDDGPPRAAKPIEGSLTDLRWMDDGMLNPGEVTYDPSGSKNPNNIKPEAQAEWGYGDISHVFDEPNAGEVGRNIPEADLGDVGPTIVFARDLMNQGAARDVVDRELKANFTKEDIRKSVPELKKLFAMEGLIGRVAIDARGYDNCEQALMRVARSPYLRFIWYVIGCQWGDPHMMQADDGSKIALVESSGNGIDDFFGEGEPQRIVKAATVPLCRSTHVRMFEGAMDDLDEQWMDDTLIDLSDVSGMSEADSGRIREMDSKPLERIKEAFRTIDRNQTELARMRYSEPVSASEHVIHAADNEIELAGIALPDIDVDPTNHAIQQIVATEPEPEFIKQGSIDMIAEFSDFELSGATAGPLEGIELSDAGDLSLAPERQAAAPLDIDHRAGDHMSDGIPVSILAEVAVDMTMTPDGIFAGCDEVALEQPRQAEADIDIDMNSEMDW